MENLEKYLFKRKICPLCLSNNLSQGIPPHNHLKFPLLPVCVEEPRNEDHLIDFTIGICNDCGLLMLLEIPDPEILYKIFHSDGLGQVWENHYEAFSKLIRKYCPNGRILEIGAGQGKLVKKLLPFYPEGLEIMDPQYFGPTLGVTIHPYLFSINTSKEFENTFDAVVSSHTLEHFTEFKEYFENSWKVLKKGGLLFTSIPNQEFNFAKGYGNQLNFEHPSVCTNVHWIYLHYKYGFRIKEIYFYLDHSVQFVAEKIDPPIPIEINVKEFSLNILKQYEKSIADRINTVRQLAKVDKENWIFGASNLSQPLFVYGLEESYFQGVLDNSPLKHGKRLYGTSLLCKKPEEILADPSKKYRVFLNIASYNTEVYEQIKKINSSVECIFL